MQNILVAVYGTLKQNYHNYNVYLKGYIPVFTGFVDINYKLFSNGRYPMAVKSEKYHSIFVEIFKVEKDKFDQLVSLEKPYGYHHESIKIPEIEDEIEIFVYTEGIPPDGFKLVENGNWKASIPWE